jgi:RNA polymerase sigma-70 factor (ECF subfamily)
MEGHATMRSGSSGQDAVNAGGPANGMRARVESDVAATARALVEPPAAVTLRHRRDLELARAALAGEAAARREFVARMACVPKFLAVMNARSGRPFHDDALEDLVQETLVEIWRRLGSYAGLASLETWAYRFCQRVLSSRLRAARRRLGRLDRAGSTDPGAPAEPADDYEHVYSALDKVGAIGASIVRQKHFDHLTLSEIARRLQIPTSSAKTHYQRALARLRELLAPFCEDAGR